MKSKAIFTLNQIGKISQFGWLFLLSKIVGTIVLREQAFNPLPIYSPGLGGLYVAEPYRCRGIGAKLIKAGMKAVKDQGYENVFAGTTKAQSIFVSLGWEPIKSVRGGQEQVVLYRSIFKDVSKQL